MPPDDMPNLALLIKLMKMTTSTNDGEAIVAMRKANEQVAKFGGDWETILRGKVTIIGDPFINTPIPDTRKAPPPPHQYRAHHQPPSPTQPPSYPPTYQKPKTYPSSKGNPIPNKFSGNCRHCRVFVPAGSGWAVQISSMKWKLECNTCHTQGPRPSPTIDDIL